LIYRKSFCARKSRFAGGLNLKNRASKWCPRWFGNNEDNMKSLDKLVSDTEVAAELGVTSMSLWRWDRDIKMIGLGWPVPVRLNRRKFRSRAALEAFKAKLVDLAIQERAAITRRQRG
jgi:hypothetical protein